MLEYGFSLTFIRDNTDQRKLIFWYILRCETKLRLNDYYDDRVRGHPLSTYAKSSEKLTFLTPWGLEISDFRKILCLYLIDSPFWEM